MGKDQDSHASTHKEQESQSRKQTTEKVESDESLEQPPALPRISISDNLVTLRMETSGKEPEPKPPSTPPPLPKPDNDDSVVTIRESPKPPKKY